MSDNTYFQLPPNRDDYDSSIIEHGYSSQDQNSKSFLEQPEPTSVEHAAWMKAVGEDQSEKATQELEQNINEGRSLLDWQHDHNHFVEQEKNRSARETDKQQREIGARATATASVAANNVLPFRMAISSDKEEPGQGLKVA